MGSTPTTSPIQQTVFEVALIEAKYARKAARKRVKPVPDMQVAIYALLAKGLPS